MKSVFILVTLLLSGCMVGPNYRGPPDTACGNWITETEPVVSTEMPPPTDWWHLFNDPLLDRYIALAALNNREILEAEAAICEARAVRQTTASALFPHVGANLSAIRAYFSKNGALFASGMGLPSQAQIPHILNLYNVLIDATWEIDLFGKTRRKVEAAEANIDSAIEQRSDLLVSLLAEVAISYIELRSNQQRGLLVEDNLALLEENARLIRKRLEAGYVNRLDLEKVEAEIAQMRATLPGLYAQVYQAIYALSVLTGNCPEALLCELLPIQPLPSTDGIITIGMRSDLVRRRPDIRLAERQLAAATANIGVAVASFFPSFILGGGIGLQSSRLSNLFQGRSLTWAIGGDINIPIYQGGNLVGNLHIAEAQAAEAAFRYQQTVLQALQEAESNLIAYTEELKASSQLQDAVARYQELVFLSNERFSKGLVSLLDLLDNERQLNNAQQNALTSETNALIDLISLFKALGGGWESCD